MRKINLSSKLPTVRSDLTKEFPPANTFVEERSEDKINLNQQLLLKSAPGKLLYSIRETAKVLGVSYEFVRSKVYAERVLAKSFGARKLIHVYEVSRLLTEGLSA